MRRGVTMLVALAAVVGAVGMSCGSLSLPFFTDSRTVGERVPAGGPLPLAVDPDADEPPELDLSAPPVALAPPGGAIIQQGVVRIPKPKIDPKEPRRVGIQVGHWQTNDVPKEYGTRIIAQTGTSWAGYDEVDVTMEIAERMATLLTAQGIKVDILPTTVPEGYLADVFIALHCDGDGVGELSGFKMAHGSRRGPYEDKLLSAVKDTYAKATGMDYDSQHITRNMSNYYAFSWSRYQHAASPFTPATIIELGFLSNDDDRRLLVNKPDVIATGVVNGILAFLDANPRSKIFGEDLLIPQAPIRQGQAASPSPSR
ncbi:MAG TPA: N-acetylmuramoyl-L-alanine amidase [Candidatus Limnocylindrales bacterium]|nr:N-acetylmuramoyl-L-alanine amidase [Candidatus Limnocylindrales bacterium]